MLVEEMDGRMGTSCTTESKDVFQEAKRNLLINFKLIPGCGFGHGGAVLYLGL
jgi:hypothetical protein